MTVWTVRENWSGLLQNVENQIEIENFRPRYIIEKKCKLKRWETNIIHDKRQHRASELVTQSNRSVCTEDLRK